ncbi:hypothetical protein [Jiella avicenniae]|uniref:DUF4350 domain-containing protein n=1 Tax=Jiella avicenniae TaxID=2907202 RepID=A0A9X1P1D5_9HYPH|nr:hypothetical protein [Jiella avicenniae]MCE7029282.1 hypothetical protein [Jiella avicenniae]
MSVGASVRPPARGAGLGENAKGAGILAAVVLVVVLLVVLGGRRSLEDSAIGFAGLEHWLAVKGVATVPAIDAATATATIRILPVYDPRLAGEGARQEDGAENERGALAPRPLSRAEFVERANAGPMLAVLPKWRGGIVTRAAAHPDLLVPDHAMDFFGERPVARLPQRGLATFEVYDADYDQLLAEAATLYSAQVLSPALDERCRPILVLRDEGSQDLGTLLADCTGTLFEGAENALFVLSDPDVLDNAGLAAGDNAALAVSLVEGFAGNAKVFVETDSTSGPATAAARSAFGGEDPRERTIGDLDRFFAYPFSLFWIGVVLVTGLALWRGSRRFGRPQEDVEPAEASKRRTIDASRRILMLAKADDALVERHVVDRVEALASALIGTGRRTHGPGDDAAAIRRFLSRRAPELGEKFAAAHAAVTALRPGEGSRFDALAKFESVIQETWHDFGRAAGPARQDRR